MNFPPKLQKRISDTVQSLEALAKNPLFMDTLIIDEIIAFYRDAIKSHRSQLLAIVSQSADLPPSPFEACSRLITLQKDDDSTGTELSIKLEELAAHWRTILRDIHNIQTHINHLQEIASSTQEQRGRTRSPHRRGGHRQHTRQQSSEVLGPQAAEIFKLQNSTCEFWARCVNMYLERTTDRMKKSVSRPLAVAAREGSLWGGVRGGAWWEGGSSQVDVE